MHSVHALPKVFLKKSHRPRSFIPLKIGRKLRERDVKYRPRTDFPTVPTSAATERSQNEQNSAEERHVVLVIAKERRCVLCNPIGRSEACHCLPHLKASKFGKTSSRILLGAFYCTSLHCTGIGYKVGHRFRELAPRSCQRNPGGRLTQPRTAFWPVLGGPPAPRLL